MVNVGPRTAVETFTFDNNAYFQIDGSASGILRLFSFLDDPDPPNLPVEETNMIHQVDPELIDPGTSTMRIGSENPVFDNIGPDAVDLAAIRRAFDDPVGAINAGDASGVAPLITHDATLRLPNRPAVVGKEPIQ